MKLSPGRAATVAILSGAFLVASPAAAQPRDRAAGEALFEAARELMDKGQYEAACKKFEASEHVDPALGTLLNLANCLEKVGRLTSAWERFDEAAHKLPAGDDRLPIARERAAALKPRLPKLELTLDDHAPAGTQVFRDDVVVDPGALGAALPLDPGAHRIVVRSPGRSDVELSVDVREGKVVKRRLFAGAPGVASPAPPPPPAPATEPPASGAPVSPGPEATSESWWTGRRTAGVAVSGVGVVGLLTSLGAGVVAIGKKSTVSQSCNPTTRICANQAAIDAAGAGQTASTVSTATFVLGVAALAGGVTLVVIGAPATPVKVGGAVLPGGGGLTMAGAF